METGGFGGKIADGNSWLATGFRILNARFNLSFAAMQAERPIKVLYLSYDGMTDPLGQSQVLGYLLPLSKRGEEVHLVSFEKPVAYASGKGEVLRTLRDYHNLHWHPLIYHKKPPVLSTLNDLRKGLRYVKQLAREQGPFDIVHCRGYLPPLFGGLWAQQDHGAKLIFDMRGWWPDEKRESGNWDSPLFLPIYRWFKRREKEFFRKADLNISLTRAGAREIEHLTGIPEEEVLIIPTCVNFEYFPPFDPEVRSRVREELNIPEDAWVVVYSGSLGGNYPVGDILATYKAFLEEEPESYLYLLTLTPRETVQAQLQEHGIDERQVRYRAVPYTEVGPNLMAADVGLIFYKQAYSVIGRSPTKLGEYWASGLPAIAPKGIGDVDNLLTRYAGGGWLLPDTEPATLRTTARNALQNRTDKDTLRAYATDYYSLEEGVNRYLSAHRRLAGRAFVPALGRLGTEAEIRVLSVLEEFFPTGVRMPELGYFLRSYLPPAKALAAETAVHDLLAEGHLHITVERTPTPTGEVIELRKIVRQPAAEAEPAGLPA